MKMLKPNASKIQKHMEVDALVAEFLRTGGKINRSGRTGTPKDLYHMRRTGWLFGGKRTYVATLNYRQEHGTGDLYAGPISRPKAHGKQAYDLA